MRFTGAAALCALLITSPSASAQPPAGSPRDRLVVSAEWLAQHVHDPNLVVLHVGIKDTYDKGHIPGARFGDWMQLHTMDTQPGALTLEMPPAAQIHDALESFGISDNSRVVVYQTDGWWSPTTRVLLTLDYAGLSDVLYLDGGLKAWAAAGQALSTEVPAPKKGTLAPLTPRTSLIVDAAFVQAHAKTPGFAIVDARNTEFYDGTSGGGQRGQTKKFGHIPGAVSAPFSSFSADGRLKSNEEIAAVFTNAGVKPGDTVIGYCHIGQQATAMLFAARLVGHDVMLYDGSFEDWNTRGLPLELPKKDK